MSGTTARSCRRSITTPATRSASSPRPSSPSAISVVLARDGEVERARAAGHGSGPGQETYRREWAAAIRRYRNHPSILCLGHGERTVAHGKAMQQAALRAISNASPDSTRSRAVLPRRGRPRTRGSWTPKNDRRHVGLLRRPVRRAAQSARQSRQVQDAPAEETGHLARGGQLHHLLPARPDRSVPA